MFICLYSGSPEIRESLDELIPCIQETVPDSVPDIRDDFFRYWLQQEDQDGLSAIAGSLAKAKVVDPGTVQERESVLPGETAFEKRFLLRSDDKPTGILYDGNILMSIMAGLIPREEIGPKHCHIVVTRQLFGTWDTDDLRYHARTSLYGLPSIISTEGLVQAPARPRDVYFEQIIAGSPDPAGRDDRYLKKNDTRIPEVMKGHVLQGIFYQLTGTPFCADRGCRLFNAHWQEDLLYAQTRNGAGLCEFHKTAIGTSR